MQKLYERKRILYIHHSKRLGGAHRSLAFLIQELDKNEYEPYVLMPGDGKIAQLFRDAGAKVIVDSNISPFHGTTVAPVFFRRFVNNFRKALPTYRVTKNVISKTCPHIVHLNSTCLFMAAMAVRHFSKQIKIITHVREPLLDSYAGKILRYMNHRYVDAYIAVDQYGLSKLNTRHRIATKIYNFVDLSQYDSRVRKNILRKEADLESDTIIFLYLARVSPGNGTLDLVRLAKKMSLEYPKNHFFIVGFDYSGINSYQDKVFKEAVSNSNIHLMDFREDVIDLIASSDVMVCPFTEPHFSRAIVEASAMGIPSIASNIPGPNELVVDEYTGLLYDPDNENSFFDAVKTMSHNRTLRQRYGKNAIVFANENFDSKKNADKTFAVYDQLLSW